MRRAPRLVPQPHELAVLGAWTHGDRSGESLYRRAAIVLRAAQGATNAEIAKELGVAPATVGLWRRRFAVHGLEGIRMAAPRPGRACPQSQSVESRILHATSEAYPTNGLRWTTRTLARFLGLEHMQVYRTWRKHSVVPPLFATGRAREDALPWVDVLGVFRAPPLHAIVFGVGPFRERSEGATSVGGRPAGAPGRPSEVLYVPAPGGPELTWGLGKVRELLPEPRDRSGSPYDLLIFLRAVERDADPGLSLYLIAECPDEQMHARLNRWIARRPRISAEILPGASSWETAVQAFLRKWEPTHLSRASFLGVGRFAEALARFAGRSSSQSRAFTWTRSTEALSSLGPAASRSGSIVFPNALGASPSGDRSGTAPKDGHLSLSPRSLNPTPRSLTDHGPRHEV